MKKTTGILMSAALLLSMAACGNTAAPEGPAAADSAQTKTASPKKILVAYYSYSGNTQAVAQQIAKATGGTLFEITTDHQYPAAYNAMTAQAKKEIQAGFKPELTSQPENWADYDMVFVGSPNWWGTYAPAVSAFLTAYDFTGKTVVPFFTHGGGGMQNCERDMKKQLAGATFGAAMTFPGRSSGANEKTLAAWLTQLGAAK